MLMECDRERSISFIPHSYSICFSGYRGETNAACFFFLQSIRLEEKNPTQLLFVLSFMMFASLRKTNSPQPMAYQNTQHCRSRQPANSWDLQLKLHAYNYTDEGGTSGQQQCSVEGKHSSRQSCKALYLVSKTGQRESERTDVITIVTSQFRLQHQHRNMITLLCECCDFFTSCQHYITYITSLVVEW